MKFSIGYDNPRLNTATYNYAITSPVGSHWELALDQGGIQGGSSGAPVMKGADQDRLIIGQHHGRPNSNECAPNAVSRFGAFHVSWEGGGTNTTRLSNWLAPDDRARRELRTLRHAPEKTSIHIRKNGRYVDVGIYNPYVAYNHDFEMRIPKGFTISSSKLENKHSFYHTNGGSGTFSFRARGRNSTGVGEWSDWAYITIYNLPVYCCSSTVPDDHLAIYPNPALSELNISVDQNIAQADNALTVENTLQMDIGRSYMQNY